MNERIASLVGRLSEAEAARKRDPIHLALVEQVEAMHAALDLVVDQRDGETFQDRIARLADEIGALRALLARVRAALNVGPPRASDIGPDVPAEEVVRIVEARTIAMLDERAQRVALAERLRDAPRHVVGWLTRSKLDATDFTHAIIDAVKRGALEVDEAAEAIDNLGASAKIMVRSDVFDDDEIPF